jgi:molybdopterin-guanine dinucleotide biosynthesis protein A
MQANSVKPLWGLCLIGGLSTRMGTDKSALHYHALPQWQHVAHLLALVCDRVFWSARTSQVKELGLPRQLTLIDSKENAGPAAGLYSAFSFSSEVDWFILACDYPFCSKEDLNQLVEFHQTNRKSSAFLDSDGLNPEPLFAIWDKQAQVELKARFSEQAFVSPRDVLIKTGCVSLAPRKQAIINVNTIENLL